jgi:homoserine O-acetyltransferase
MSLSDSITMTFGPSYREVEVGRVMTVAEDSPLRLDSGAEIGSFPIAYQTYGTLNAAKDNAVLVCHGLTADQYVSSSHPVTGKGGWWDYMIGEGKAVDTNRFFVICCNVIGGCMGSFGPKSLNPATGKPFGLDFPVLTIADMARAQHLLVQKLGITKLACIIGGSMGGMIALQYASLFAEEVAAVVTAATSARQSAQNIAFNEIGRQAIMVDADWHHGHYAERRSFPAKGLAVARMAAHVTYLSEHGLQSKFGRELQNKNAVTFGFEADFRVESYLRHQGISFVERFDPNSYFYITRALDYFDLAAAHEGKLSRAFAGCAHQRYLIISFSTDWLYPTSESMRLVRALNAVGAPVSFTEIQSDRGHDAFLLEIPEYIACVKGFFESL